MAERHATPGVAEPVAAGDPTCSATLAWVRGELHQLLSHQAALVVLASALGVELERDPSQAHLAASRICVAAEAAIRDLRHVLARLEDGDASPGELGPPRD